MKAWSRGERVGKLVGRIVAERLAKGTSDPSLEGVVITGAKMSTDIKQATIYFQLLTPGGEEGAGDVERVEQACAALDRAKHMLHQELRSQMTIKFIPKLRFRHDVSLDRVERLESIFQELETERRNGS